MRVGIFRIAIFALALMTSGLALRADQALSRQDRWELIQSEEFLTEFGRRNEILRQELDAKTAPEWAGEYYTGDGLGKNVRVTLAPSGGFVYGWHGCLGLYDANYGTAGLRDGVVVLEAEMPVDSGPFAGLHSKYLLIPWGERRYLIAPEEMQDFANAINSGREPCRHCALFLMRDGDSDIEVSGKPSLPAEYARLLLEKPIEVTVAQVIERTDVSEKSSVTDDFTITRTTKVLIDGGKDAGIHPGMAFFYADTDYGFAEYRVVSTTAESSIATAEEYVSPEDHDPPARAGLKLSTHSPWNPGQILASD